ncbi:hypothetical protein ASE04_28650 [Rhizobium sp. Root708]|uniref:flavin-containing monooxygenase n=1 Tax=Rhizobium sp. Root708 TaxID=1736592 RepID=UPI0007009E5D|nr:NAD(P)/FAD-dependent oxidoreductase [Rhizobium sp. Root708]KRB57071.1 hypothetical protein ASE04_28650 [Rhizobium sp. Root708]
MTNPEPIEQVVIIGAGLSGLTAAYVLARKGIRARILEREMQIGVPWSKRHPQLTLNTHRSLSHLPELNYPAGTGAFPKRDAVIAHLSTFAMKHALPIEYGVDMEKIGRAATGFRLQTSAGEILTRNVVFAIGRDGKPRIPNWEGAGNFQGEVLHAAEFGHSQRYAGKRVLVAGGGNSGFDVLNHLMRVETAEAWFSVRGGAAVLPKRLKGFAVHRLSPLMDVVPASFADAAIALTQRLAFGDIATLGFPPARSGAATRLADENVAIPVDDGAIDAIRVGRIRLVGEIAKFTADTVFTKDGQSFAPDVVIAATGYASSLSDLLDDADVKINSTTMTSDTPGIWLIGMKPGLVSYFRNALNEATAMSKRIVVG